MDTYLEQNRNEDELILSKINFDAPFNITVTLADDEEELEEPYNNANKENSTTNNNAEIIQKAVGENNLKESISSDTFIKNSIQNTHALNNAIEHIDPLEIVSDSLISYIKLYSYYQSRCANHESFCIRLKCTKKIYFTLCYYIVLDCILPREKEQDFIIKFVWKTIDRSKMDISFNSLYNLLKELLLWTKQTYSQIVSSIPYSGNNSSNNSDVIVSNTPKNTNANLELIANQNPSNSSILKSYIINTGNREHPNTNEEIRSSSTTCLFTAGEPGQELSINVSTETLKSLESLTNNINNSDQQRKQKRKRHLHDSDTNANRKKLSTNENDKSHIPNNHLTQSIPTQDKHEMHLKENDALLSRSSTSRDSGFSSPPYISTIQMDQNRIQGHNQTENVFPIANHVASSVPSALYRTAKTCRVCGTFTDMMCIGCYHVYYCSQRCQASHWRYHKYDCFKFRRV